MVTQTRIIHKYMRLQRSLMPLNLSKVKRFSQLMTQQEVFLNSSNRIKESSFMLQDRIFTVTKSAYLNASPKMRRKEAYLLRPMETLISVASTNLTKNSQKDSQSSVVSRDQSFLVVKSSVLLLHVPSSANLRSLSWMKLLPHQMRRARRRFRLLSIM